MFDRSKLESLRDVSVTRIGDTLSYGFPETVLDIRAEFAKTNCKINIPEWAKALSLQMPMIKLCFIRFVLLSMIW